MRYTAYGLTIESELALPELLTGIKNTPDVTVRYGKVSADLDDAMKFCGVYQAKPGQFLLEAKNIARYLVSNGQEICIEQMPQASENDIRVFLLGSVLAALLHQRDILTLHASAIQTKDGAVLFVGKSGYGKSTLLAAMLQRGYTMLADDVAGIILDEADKPVVLPAIPRNRLWSAVAQKLQLPLNGEQKMRNGMEKYLMPVSRFCTKPVLINRIYILGLHEKADAEIKPVNHFKAFELLSDYTFRKKFLDGLHKRQEQFRILVPVVNTTTIKQLNRPSNLNLINQLADTIAQDIS